MILQARWNSRSLRNRCSRRPMKGPAGAVDLENTRASFRNAFIGGPCLDSRHAFQGRMKMDRTFSEFTGSTQFWIAQRPEPCSGCARAFAIEKTILARPFTMTGIQPDNLDEQAATCR